MSRMLEGTGPISLVISDVDGTLVNKAKELTVETIDAVRRLRSAGVPFTLISARPISGVMPMVERLGITGPVGAFNGGTVFKADGGVVEQHRVNPDIVRGMIELAADYPVSTWFFAGGQWYADNIDEPHVPRERLSAAQEPVITTDFSAYYDRVDKITFVHDDPELLGRLTDEGHRRFGDRATVGRSQTYYLDVTDLRANKGDGITALAAAHGVPLAQVAVFGDMNNDVPMFDLAGFAVAMGQAPDEVKARADAVSTSNEDNGVAHAIDELVLPRIGAPARLRAEGGVA